MEEEKGGKVKNELVKKGRGRKVLEAKENEASENMGNMEKLDRQSGWKECENEKC